MKQKWTQFLVDRVSNKLFVEQIRKRERISMHAEGEKESFIESEKDQMKNNRAYQDLGNS